MRAVAGTGGRWIWGVSGAVTAVALGVPGILLIGRAGAPANAAFAVPQHSAAAEVTVPGHVTSISVDSYGAPVTVQAGDASQVRVAETIMWNGPDGVAADVPKVTQTVSDGHLTLAAPECVAADFRSGPRFDPGFGKGTGPLSAAPVADGGLMPSVSTIISESISVKGGPVFRESVPDAPSAPSADCMVAYDVIAPKGVSVSVSSAGGPVSVSGVAGANLDSGGGIVSAARVAGPLTVTSDGGIVHVDGLTGTLNADSGGAPVMAVDIAAPSAVIATEGGSAFVSYSAAPASVTIHTDGGPARLAVPGGPYALTADSGDGPETVGIPFADTAARSITIGTDGGTLLVEPAGAAGGTAG